MKILGRIKKSKVLTAVMTAVLIFQSACPTGLAYAAQKSGVSAYAAGQTIDQALGATKTVESVLSQHENDEYYLTTPYGNKGPHGEGGAIDTWDCWKPKGEYGSGAYMNCTGFVVAVLRACGANTSIIGNYTAKDGYNRGNETNASKWDEYCRDNNAVSYTFSSKEQMLASGILEKGDIIYMEPADWNHSNSDCHIGFGRPFLALFQPRGRYCKGLFPELRRRQRDFQNHAQVSRSLLPCHQDVAQGISDTA